MALLSIRPSGDVGIGLVLDWYWIGIGLVLDWYWIGIGLVLGWYWIGIGFSYGLAVSFRLTRVYLVNFFCFYEFDSYIPS